MSDTNADFIDTSSLEDSGYEGCKHLFMSALPELKTLEAITHDCFNPPLKHWLSWWWLADSGRFSCSWRRSSL